MNLFTPLWLLWGATFLVFEFTALWARRTGRYPGRDARPSVAFHVPRSLMPALNRSHYSGSFQVRAARVRELAYADPNTRCWRCQKTLAEVPGSVWHAGHTQDGNSAAPLMPEHSSCNQSAGAKAGHKKRALNPSRRWY